MNKSLKFGKFLTLRNSVGISKKADFSFAKIAGILILLILLLWVIIWYGGLRQEMIAMTHNFFNFFR